MLDGDVRAATLAHLTSIHEDELADTRIVEELGICGTVRVDIAVMNGRLAGYELKSARDTLRRLPAQVSMYSQVFDESTLVVAENHLAAASEMVPTWWGIIGAHEDGNGVILTHRRSPELNPSIDPYRLVWLLWKDEMLEELVERRLDKGVRSKPRAALAHRLASEVDVAELRDVVRERLKTRTNWRSAP